MSDFPLRTLGELADINPKTTLAKDTKYPFVAMEDLTPGQRYTRSKQLRQAAGGARFQGGDTLFARITPCLENGKIAQYDPDAQLGFGSTEFIVLRAKAGLADPAYVYYLAMTDIVKAPAIGSMSGASGRQRADAKTIFQTLVPAPDLPTQRQIASILGAYDDLIDVNRRRVAVLEEMAQGLFEEWFIRFRSPGPEETPILDAPDGSLPESWMWGVAADLIAFDPKTAVPRDGLKPFISMGHLDTATSLIAPPEQRAGNSGTKFRNGDTLFARITPCLENGKTGLVRGLPGQGGIGFGSTEFIVMRGEAAGPAFTYCLARHSSFRANARNSMSGATGRQRARTASLASFAMPVPPLDLLRRFDEAVWPMLELVGNLGTANETLASARDLLLPRLISGQLSVAEAERELEQAA
ncbi:restriction endonuclease subunit S [Rhizobium ruizarguesonis]